MSNAPAAPTNSPPHDRVFGRLERLATAAMLPWLLLSCVSIMALGSPNAIITPMIWVVFICIWSYPLAWLGGRLSARLLRVYGQYDRANLLMKIPGAWGIYLFSMMVLPLAMMPMFSDGYLALMTSCVLSILVTSWAMGFFFRSAE